MADQMPEATLATATPNLDYPLNSLETASPAFSTPEVVPENALTSASASASASTANLQQNIQQKLAGLANSELGERAKKIVGQVKDEAARWPSLSREAAGRVDQHARANPWLHIGLVGVGFFALGCLLGRKSRRSELN